MLWPVLQPPPPVVIVISEAAILKLGLPLHVSLAIETAPAPELLKELQPPLGRAMVIVPELGNVVEPMVNVNWKLLPVLPSIAVVGETVSVPLPSPVVAALYGPTNGPPLAIGAAPAGWIASMLVSETARAMFRRPLPV